MRKKGRIPRVAPYPTAGMHIRGSRPREGGEARAEGGGHWFALVGRGPVNS